MMIKEKQKAALFMLIAAFFYAFMAGIVKSIEGIPVFEKLFFRNTFGMVFIVLITLRQRIPLKGVNKIGLLGRGITGFIAAAFYYLALTKTPLGETVTISNTYPFLVLLLSAFFLKEKINKKHIIALILSFAGTLLIIRPGFSVFNADYFFAILTAVFTAITYTILKHVRETDSAVVVVFYFSMISTLLCIPFMVFGHFVMPDTIQLLKLIALGLAGTFYQWCVSTAYKYAPAGEISIYSYTSIVFSAIMGIVIWGELPAFASILGMIAIFGGAFVIFRKDAKNEDQSYVGK